MQSRHLLTCLAVLALTLAGAAHAETEIKNNLVCNPFALSSANLDAKVADYQMKASCTFFHESILTFSSQSDVHQVSSYNGELTVHSHYDRVTKKAQEDSSWTATGGTDNTGVSNGQWTEVPSHTFSGTAKAPFIGFMGGSATITASCKHDPYSNATGASAHCTGRSYAGHEDNGTYSFFSAGSAIKFTFNGAALPIFFTDKAVNDQKAQALDLAGDEAKVTKPTIVSPTNGQHFYSQGFLLKAIIPSSYKNDQQACCLIEISKADGNGNWLAPLTIGGKSNLDTQGWQLAFDDFKSLGFGAFRIHVAPFKYNALDAQPWSDWVEFTVLPKEVLEVPKLVQPQPNQTYAATLPIQVSIPAVAKQAGVVCCDLQFEVFQNGGWFPSKSLTDTRLGQNDNAVQYDANSVLPGGGKAHVRARFIKSGETLGWSAWVEFNVPVAQTLLKPIIKAK